VGSRELTRQLRRMPQPPIWANESGSAAAAGPADRVMAFTATLTTRIGRPPRSSLPRQDQDHAADACTTFVGFPVTVPTARLPQPRPAGSRMRNFTGMALTRDYVWPRA
jgi:hypothetical protein